MAQRPKTSLIYKGKQFEFHEGLEPLYAQRYLETHADVENFSNFVNDKFGGTVKITDIEKVSPPETTYDNNPLKPHRVQKESVFHKSQTPFRPPMKEPKPARFDVDPK
eukprot:gb/GECH01011566.1/.p1 GENE.gb/GECH01011566.1/~~gb/GECH01011566.1/.p1  ORF type:complete len:108 (+),score=26.13 gb/GECH01011566.1/:1-324(+)